MLEIEEKIPFYICEKDHTSGMCVLNGGNECFEECNHVTNPMYALNKSSVMLLDQFFETFNVVIDDMGRLLCIEKENNNG